MKDDLIKRSDAIKALNREKSDWNCDYNVPIDNCIKRLNKVKSADRYYDDFCSYGEREGEPQTELVNDSPILVKDLVDDEFNPYDEECMRCKHLKLQCEFVPSYCKYEPRDEPQTEREGE